VSRVNLITVTPAGDPHVFGVVVSGAAGETRHRVTVPPAEAEAAGTAPVDLVRAAFEFLLEREPADAILPEFEIGVIRRYFAGFDEAMARRFGR
jgi:hypothetical protein